MPYGEDWRRELEERHPLEVRHLVVHDRHTVGVNDHDAAFIKRHPDALAAFAANMALTPGELRGRIDEIVRLGATRTTFSPYMGSDWASAMRAHATALGL
jgi:5,10-methylenetetrahydromethanopterin reductase